MNSEERFLCKEAMIWLEPALNVLFPAGERGTRPRPRAMCLPVSPRRCCRSISSLSFLRVLFDLRPDFLPPTKDFWCAVCLSEDSGLSLKSERTPRTVECTTVNSTGGPLQRQRCSAS